MVVGEASIHNIMGGMESTGGVRLHNHKRKLKQRFDIIKKLGQGTYGKVQLGINKETGQEVAIKTIKKCKIQTEADLIRIRREIQIMSSVQHPNIIHIYEVFENREKMVLVMEYAAGGELYDYLSERKVLTELEARRIFRQISTAVFYCHKHKICHRDLKLENILLDQVGNAKIADFGLSNVFDERRLLSTFCGSPLYASPEIVKGTPYHGPEVDCWSLGVLLYTLVYGAMPFDGSNFKRLVKQISQSDYFEPRKPSPASPLIKEMLTVCPTRRADIEKICTHWWVNEGYEQNCLDIAEELAAQTPVRLDLLLSLVPQSASAEKLVVGDQQAGGDVANSMSSETLVPTRCHSVGSLMELDQNNSDRRIRELVEEEPRATASGDAKRKLETTPSMDETVAAGVKRKERSRRKERVDDRDPRSYRSTSRHHSAPIPCSIMEEAMEVDPTVVTAVPTSNTVDLNKIEAVCLELIKETREKSPSKERSKTPVATEEQDKDALSEEVVAKNSEYGVGEAKQKSNKVTASKSGERFSKSPEKTQKSPERKKVIKKKVTEGVPKGKNDTCKPEASSKDESLLLASEASNVVPITKGTDKTGVVVKDEKKNVKKLKEKAASLDSELLNESVEMLAKPMEKRRSKIFETAEKFNQIAASVDSDKPKKIFIPGVNVGGTKRAFERKASLSSSTLPQTVKTSSSKVIIDVPTDKKDDKGEEKSKEPVISQANDKDEKRDEEKKRAVDIITGAIGKPPVQRKANGSPPTSPENHDINKLDLKVQVGPNDVRTATVSVSTPVETKFPFEPKQALHAEAVLDTSESGNIDDSFSEEPKKSSKMEITLKSATLPRPRKTSKAEITLAGIKSPESTAFKSEVEAKIDAFHPQKLRTQRSEVAFPVAAAVPQVNRSSSLEPEGRPKITPKERIIPIQVESEHQQAQHSSTPPPKPPMPQRSMSQRSGSLSRQSTADSDTDSTLGSTTGPEPIRKSPREYIIPIAVEGGGYVTPRSGSVEPESKTSTPTSINAPRSRFGRPRRMSSLLSDASEDEPPFSTLHRDSDDLLQRHMHRLRSSRPTRQPLEHADSLSSGEDDDDDGFELLTAENLFSTLLSRVRSLTQRLNVDDNRGTGFPNSRLLGRLDSSSPQGFWSRRLSESQFRRSLSRDTDRFGRKDSTGPTSPGISNSPGTRSTPSRESIFEMGSNTLPRDKAQHEDTEAESMQIRNQAQESLEQNFTPSLARRLSRQFIEQTRQSLPRSPSVPRDKTYQSASNLMEPGEIENQYLNSSSLSNEVEFRERSAERNVRRSNSLLDSGDRINKFDRRSPRRSISLFDDEDKLLPPLPRQIMTLGRKYRDIGASSTSGIRRDNLYNNYRPDKIQEESQDDVLPKVNVKNVNGVVENGSVSEGNSDSMDNSNTNLVDATSSVSTKSSGTSTTELTSNKLDYNLSYKSDISRDFENRLLAAENLIKESKLKNLGPSRYDVNLSSSYKDTNKCDKESLGSISDSTGIGKRRSYIPSLRLRSGSLTRESTMDNDRRRSFAGSQDILGVRAQTPERSILSKFFKPSGSKEGDTKEKSQKSSGQRRISRFLRPDFFDTPREESRYVKEKEAQKAAENERRKSRFIKKRHENKEASAEEKQVKESKNKANSIAKEKSETLSRDKSDKDVGSVSDDIKPKFERQTPRNSFLHSLEKKLEKFRSNDDSSKSTANGGILIEQRIRSLRENSVPPTECPLTESNLIKRAVSVEDLTVHSAPLNAPKGKVSSVLGLFKNIDTRSAVNGTRPQNTILSKLKKNSYKVSSPDTVLDRDDVPSTSKIPTKHTKTDSRSAKKMIENKKSPEKTVTESKKSPPKDKTKENEKNTVEKMGVKTKKFSPEQMSLNIQRKSSPERSIEKTTDTKDNGLELEIEKSIGLTEKRNSLPDKVVPSNTASFEKMMDNKETESEKKESEKIKRSTDCLSSLTKNELTIKGEKNDDAEKKLRKVPKAKETIEREAEGGTKRKRIVRVVKKVVKKSSDSSDSKSDGKEKSSKTPIKKSPVEEAVVNKSKEKSPVTQNSKTVKEPSRKCNATVDTKAERSVNGKISTSADENLKDLTAESSTKRESALRERINVSPSDLKVLAAAAAKVNSEKISENGAKGLNCSVAQSKSLEPRTNRNSLKLDLSKIPQHTFRNVQPGRKEVPKSEASTVELPTDAESLKSSQKGAFEPENDTEKLIECLSKITHHANITGNKIIIDKALCAKDVADLQEEANDSCNVDERSVNSLRLHDQKLSSPQETVVPTENGLHATNKHNDLLNDVAAVQTNVQLNSEQMENLTSQELKDPSGCLYNSLDNQRGTPNERLLDPSAARKNQDPSLSTLTPKRIAPSKGSSNDYTDEMFSPMDDTESFDSWSIGSADMNHNRSELHSPTSPICSPYIRGDQPESIMDRIRRKSFYSRFNDRKRKTSLTAPPPGITLPVSATLPRRFSFNRPKDGDRNKPSNCSSLGRIYPERSCSFYNEDIPSYGRSSVDRDRYSDTRSTSSYSSDLKSPIEQYGSLTSSYDPLRAYMKSPTLDPIGHRKKYHSTDFGIDELGLHRSPLSSSLSNDGPMEPYSSRSTDVLPKKYGSAVTRVKAKTAEYYEELLAPSTIEYCSPRKSPVPAQYLSRYENGYHDENLNLPRVKVDKWKTYSNNNMARIDFTGKGAKDELLGDEVRDKNENASESRELPLTCSEPRPSTSTDN